MQTWMLYAALPVAAALSAFAVMRVKRAVAAREQAQLALREAELRYRTLVEQMPTVTYMDRIDEHDPTDVMPHYMSPQIEALLGYTAEEWLADPRSLDEARASRRTASASSRVGRLRRSLAGGPFEAEYRMVRRDGEVVWVRESSVLIRDESGRPRFWQGTYVDVTDRKGGGGRRSARASSSTTGCSRRTTRRCCCPIRRAASSSTRTRPLASSTATNARADAAHARGGPEHHFR